MNSDLENRRRGLTYFTCDSWSVLPTFWHGCDVPVLITADTSSLWSLGSRRSCGGSGTFGGGRVLWHFRVDDQREFARVCRGVRCARWRACRAMRFAKWTRAWRGVRSRLSVLDSDVGICFARCLVNSDGREGIVRWDGGGWRGITGCGCPSANSDDGCVDDIRCSVVTSIGGWPNVVDSHLHIPLHLVNSWPSVVNSHLHNPLHLVNSRLFVDSDLLVLDQFLQVSRRGSATSDGAVPRIHRTLPPRAVGAALGDLGRWRIQKECPAAGSFFH